MAETITYLEAIRRALITAIEGDERVFLIGEDVGPYGGYGGLHAGTKLFMMVQMLLGRLEILAPLALMTPGFWKR